MTSPFFSVSCMSLVRIYSASASLLHLCMNSYRCMSRCLLYSYFTPFALLLVVMMKMSEANSNQVILSTIYMKVTAVILPLSAGKLNCMIISSFSFFSVLLTGTSLAKAVWKQRSFSFSLRRLNI